MTHIVGIAGSLRRRSFNLGLLRAAGALMPAGAKLEILPIAGIPLYNADDEEATGLPSAVVALKDAVASADGLLLATPEYNNGIPGVMKNAVDWMSRPPRDIPHVFGRRPTALLGASPGGFGTVLAQDAWLSVFRALDVSFWFGGRLFVSRAAGLFDSQGYLADEPACESLRDFLAGFMAFVRDG